MLDGLVPGDPADPVDVERLGRLEAGTARGRGLDAPVLHLEAADPDGQGRGGPGIDDDLGAHRRPLRPLDRSPRQAGPAHRTATGAGSCGPRPGTGTGRSPRRAPRRPPPGRPRSGPCRRHDPSSPASFSSCSNVSSQVGRARADLEPGERVERLSRHPHPAGCSGSTGPSRPARPGPGGGTGLLVPGHRCRREAGASPVARKIVPENRSSRGTSPSSSPWRYLAAATSKS